MGKITKSMQPKHKETLSPWLRNYVESACTTSLPLLPQYLGRFPTRWPFGRGDLYHWIPLLNRFDEILEQFCTIYKLSEGPQSQDLECQLLLRHCGDLQEAESHDEAEHLRVLTKMGFAEDGDRQLLESVLKFSCMLLEHCGNRSIYASSPHLNNLLNATCLPILVHTLEVGSELAQRYQASVKRIGSASRQISSALLSNHYNIDLERVYQLSLPFIKTPLVRLDDVGLSGLQSSQSRSKDKFATNSDTHNASTTLANDLIALATLEENQWDAWSDIKISYYPQNSSKAIDNRSDNQSPSPYLSTPTPLRRSSTMQSPQQLTRDRITDESPPSVSRTSYFLDDQSTGGPKTFELPQSIVQSASIVDLSKNCPADMPPNSKYELLHRLRTAKALRASKESRQTLLAIRLLAITNLAYIYHESLFIEKVLRQDMDETRKYQLVYQLADLIHPSASGASDTVPLWLQTISLALLEAVSSFPSKVQEVLSAVNANVNHGILLYVIRKAVSWMKEESSSDSGVQVTEADEWRSNLYTKTLHLSMAHRVGSEMVSAGLMEILVEMLNMRSAVAQRHHSMVLAFLDGLIWTYQNAFTAFFNAEGLGAVAKLVVDTASEAQSLHSTGHGILPDQQSSAVDYQVPFYQQQTLKWLLKFVHHIMSNSYSYNGNTDRLLRNLAETSDLLTSLRGIIRNKEIFGSVVWTSAVTILSDFINNDPTSFAAISESGMITTYLEAIAGRELQDVLDQSRIETEGAADNPDSSDGAAGLGFLKDERSHPPSDQVIEKMERESLAPGILPSGEAISVVPMVLNSISLNNAGMRMVVASRAFDSFFEIFESPPHVKCLQSDPDLAHSIGNGFDELARHHPALRTSISNAVIDMVARVRYLGRKQARQSGWGAGLVDPSSDQAKSTVKQKIPVSGCHPATHDDDIDMADFAGRIEEPITQTEPTPARSSNSPFESFTPYVQALSNFMTPYLSNSTLKTGFVEAGGIELLLDISESPSLIATFGESNASKLLNTLVTQLIDHAPARGLPSLFHRVERAVRELEPLKGDGELSSSYFAPFIMAPTQISGSDDQAAATLEMGTTVVKALLNVQTFLKMLADCFTSSRSHVLQFYPVNVYDYYLSFIRSLGPLLRGILAEEAAELALVPEHWAVRRLTSETDGQPQKNNTNDDTGDLSLPDLHRTATLNTTDGTRKEDQPTFSEQASARFQNYETLRQLLHPVLPTTFPLFQSLGRALLPRREPNHLDTFPRPRQLEIAKAIADTVLEHVQPSVATQQPATKHFHYWIIMLHTIHEMLIDHPSNYGQTDRTAIQVIIPVLLAFKEGGGLDMLKTMLDAFSDAIQQGKDDTGDIASKPKVAAFGIKKILDLYYVLANGKYITDANNYFNIQRQTDRSLTVPNVYQQIVVELRAAILPQLLSLWDSRLVDKIPGTTVKRLITTFKMIATGDHEPSSTPKDKIPFSLFKYTDVRFNWAMVRTVVKDLLRDGFDEDLIHEAAFRTNGNGVMAREYCEAHKKGLAGPRNPLPQADADISGLLVTSRLVPEGESSAEVSNADPMSLDTVLSSSSTADRVFNPDDLTDPGEADALKPHDAETDPPTTMSAVNSDLGDSTIPSSKSTKSIATKEDLDVMRENLRDNLIGQCLDIVRAHADAAVEVSELINVMILRQQDQDRQDDVASTMTFALSSLVLDEEEKARNADCIASYAHLLALLLQNEQFFQHSCDILRTKVEEYVQLLQLTSPKSSENLPPWIPFILLVLEVFLCHDARPIPAEWKPPKTLDEPISDPVLMEQQALLESRDRSMMLQHLMELLPRVGKEEVLATSILRVLVILSRDHELAKCLGEKQNLQRLFVMAKQLCGSGSERLKQSKVTAHITSILRHIIEDDAIVKQIMRAEIHADFPNIQRTSRGHPDVLSYLRAMAPVALRQTTLFVEVTNEMLRFSKWQVTSNDGQKTQTLVLKESSKEADADADADADTDANLALEKEAVDPSAQLLQPSTEPNDKEVEVVQKSQNSIETKRPVVENPDGVVHFLLCELLNYREVDDKEVPNIAKESKSESKPEGSDTTRGDGHVTAEGKEAKQVKPTFKVDEHPIFVYRCFLLNCLTELLQSYNRSKMEFINFKRNVPPLPVTTPVKPRSSVLNYLIYDLLCSGSLSGAADSIAAKKRAAISSQVQKTLAALVAKTSEIPSDRSRDKYDYEDEPDLLFVRRFVLDTLLKAYDRPPSLDESLESRYSRMQSLAEFMNIIIGDKEKEHSSSTRTTNISQTRSRAHLRRLAYEKGYLDKITSSVAEINLSYPGVKRVIKYVLRVLRILTDTAKDLSHFNILPPDPSSETNEGDEASSASMSDVDDNREETPDLYRNSTLGMLEPRVGDEASDDEDDEDGEDMYGDDYDEEMDYGEEEISDGDDNISDDEDDLSQLGEIEGLHGEPGVVEVIMDEDEDGDEASEDDDSEDEDDDSVESEEMGDVDDHIDIVDEDGNPLNDGGNSDWESASSDDDDDDDDDEEEDDDDNHHQHGVGIDPQVDDPADDAARMRDMGPATLLDNMARAIMGEENELDGDVLEEMDERYMDEDYDEADDDDEEDIEDEEYVYDDDYPLDNQPSFPDLRWEWDGSGQEAPDRHRQLFLLDGQQRRPILARMDQRGGLPGRFLTSGNRDPLDFRSYYTRMPRGAGAAPNNEDGVNPLLRGQGSNQETVNRTSQHQQHMSLRLSDGLFGTGGGMRGHGDGPMHFLGDLLEFLPTFGPMNGHRALQFQVNGPGMHRDGREITYYRGPRHESRRDMSNIEPHQAVMFTVESTLDRYQEEARMIFGSSMNVEVLKLTALVNALLAPAALELERNATTEDAEHQRRLDEAKKKLDEDIKALHKLRAAQEALIREQREAEEQATAESPEITETAENGAPQQPAQAEEEEEEEEESEGQAMQGVETTETLAEASTNIDQEVLPPPVTNVPRIMTRIRGEDVDVTELGIDPEYLAALPEEFREEAIAQTVSSRRSQAREVATTGESTEVFQEFLDALPEELRLEIVQQERQDQRRRHRDGSRRQVGQAEGSAGVTATGSGSGPAAVPTAEMDVASILLSFPPELREQVLIDQGDQFMDQLPQELADQARELSARYQPPLVTHNVAAIRAGHPSNIAVPGAEVVAVGEAENGKSRRRTVVQMLDKAGIATLLRLMFITQQGSIRNYLFGILADACENRQNRFEVINTVLQILQDGSADMNAVERSFSHLSLKARKQKDKDKESELKTPQSLKRSTTSTLGPLVTHQANSEISPLMIVQQCLDLLVELCTKNPQVPWLFLTEHEQVSASLKRTLSRKGKGKDTKAHRYAVNSLLMLLDRNLVLESSVIMTHLADLLNRVTMPLQNMERRRKEAEKQIENAAESNVAAAGPSSTESRSEATPATENDAAVTEGQESATAPTSTHDIDNAENAPKKAEDKSTALKSRHLQPPTIPPQILNLVVRIFVAQECSSKTFQNTISTIKNLSAIPGAKEVFGQELVLQARRSSESIVTELGNLLPHIEKATTGTEIQGVALAQFSPGASEQNKLLRVLTALDHLFDGGKRPDQKDSDWEKGDLVNSLYHNNTFSTMWDKLGACLHAIRERENMLNVATILLPLIESLMVVCKNTASPEDLSQSQTGKDLLLSSPPAESRTADLFINFTEEHRRILNELVRNNPKLMSGTFALLVKNPKVLEFDNKRNYFNRSVHSRSGQGHNRPSYPSLQLSVRRDLVFHDSYRSLYFKTGDEMKFGKLNIRFHGEEGVDAGGVTREWFQVLARQMFDPNYVLFTPVSSDRTTFHPNKLSGINDEHLRFFKFIGRVIGKALYEGRLLDCYFSRAVYKRILGKSVSVKDMESFDPDYYKSLCWMLDNDITDIITETFSVEDDEFGVIKVVDLVPNGRDIAVVEENKGDYVRLVVEHKLLSSVKEQMESFLKGFHEIVPAELISIFNEQELELLISGLPDIDIDDWKSNTEYHNYNPSSQQIQWFWRALRSFDKEECAKLLQFVTGTSKVPLNGFKELEGMNGVSRFNIHRDYGNKDRLPTSHTCFNQLDLPEYDSYDILRAQLFKAITAGSEGFGFA